MAAASPEQVHALLAATYLGDPEARKAAEQQLKQLENVAGFPSVLLHLIAEPAVDEAVKQAAAIYLKNKITRCWRDDATNVISEQDKALIRSNILGVLGKGSRAAIVQLSACLKSMLDNDFPDKWPGYVESIQQLLSSSVADEVRTGLVGLLQVVCVYQYKTDSKRAPLVQIVKATFPQLEKIATGVLGVDSKDAQEMLKIVIKIYYRSIQTDLAKVQQDRNWMVQWGNLLIQTILLQPPASAMPEDMDEREKMPFWKAKKWAYRTLNRLFSRYGNPSVESNKAKFGAFSKMFVEHFAPLILQTYLSQTEQLVSGQIWLSRWATHSIVTFYGDCVKLKTTWKLMKPHVPAIVGYFVFPMLCFSDDDAEMWEDDPVEYIRNKTDPMEDFKSPQHAAANLLMTLVRDRPTAMPQVLEVVSAAAQSYAQDQSEAMARRKDGALNMLSTVLDLLMEDEPAKLQFKLEDFVLHFVLPELQSPYPFLRDRACEVFAKFCEYDIENKEGLMAIYRSVIACIRDPNLPVRVAAAVVLPQLLVHEEVRAAMAPDAPHIMNELLKLTNEIDIDSLTTVMEAVVEHFAEQLAPFAAEMCTSLRDTFMRIMAGTKELDDNDDDAAYMEANWKTVTAMGVLKTISTLVMSVEGSKELLLQLEVIVVPMIAYVLQNNLVDHFGDVFEIVDTFVNCMKAVSPATWQIFELIYKGIKDQSIDYMEEVLPLLDNIVTYGNATLFQTPQYKEMILDIVRMIITDENFSDSDRICGCQLVESLLLCGKGQLDESVPVFISFAFHYLNDNEEKTIAYLVHLLEVVVNCLVYNPILALQVMEHQGQTASFFTKWLQNLDDFIRVHDKRLSILGLCAILSCPVEQIPEVIRAGWPQLGVAFVKLFETWPDAVAAREELRKLHEDESDDEDEGGVEGEDVEDVEEVQSEDGDLVDEGDEYLDFLASKAPGVEGEDEDDDDSDFDGWDAELEEDIYFQTPIDNIDPYKTFATVLNDLSLRDQGLHHQLTSALSESQAQKLREAFAKGTTP